MTTNQLNAATKATLIKHIEQLEAAERQARTDAQNALNIANYFGSVISDIEKILLNSPFINQDGKFFKKLFWVLSNFNEIKAVIELIIEKIKSWRENFNKLAAKESVNTTK